MLGSWIHLTLNATLLSLEVQSVIGMRLSQIAMGQGTPAEAQLMITEKMLAFMDAAKTIAAGGSAHAVVEDYRRRVQANAERLRQERLRQACQVLSRLWTGAPVRVVAESR